MCFLRSELLNAPELLNEKVSHITNLLVYMISFMAFEKSCRQGWVALKKATLYHERVLIFLFKFYTENSHIIDIRLPVNW